MGLIRTQIVPHGQPQPTRLRVVLMPGAYHTPNQFLDAGFAQAVQRRAQCVELILAVPELDHLTDRRWLSALHDEVMAPARAEKIPLWLGGVSLGGFMALRFAAQYPRSLDGLCLLAPYLGSRIVASEAAIAAHVAGWQAESLDDDDDERRIWHYVARLSSDLAATRVFFGYGAGDRFADTQRVLARALSTSGATQRVLEGGHDWPIWRALWDDFLNIYGETS